MITQPFCHALPWHFAQSLKVTAQDRLFSCWFVLTCTCIVLPCCNFNDSLLIFVLRTYLLPCSRWWQQIVPDKDDVQGAARCSRWCNHLFMSGPCHGHATACEAKSGHCSCGCFSAVVAAVLVDPFVRASCREVISFVPERIWIPWGWWSLHSDALRTFLEVFWLCSCCDRSSLQEKEVDLISGDSSFFAVDPVLLIAFVAHALLVLRLAFCICWRASWDVRDVVPMGHWSDAPFTVIFHCFDLSGVRDLIYHLSSILRPCNTSMQ